MCDLRVLRVSAIESLTSGVEPVCWLRREEQTTDVRLVITNSEPWLISQSRMPCGAGDWSRDRRNALIRVPLFQYLLASGDPAMLVQFGMQVGASAIASAEATGQKFQQHLLVVSEVLNRRDQKPGVECWFGFAAKLSRSHRGGV